MDIGKMLWIHHTGHSTNIIQHIHKLASLSSVQISPITRKYYGDGFRVSGSEFSASHMCTNQCSKQEFIIMELMGLFVYMYVSINFLQLLFICCWHSLMLQLHWVMPRYREALQPQQQLEVHASCACKPWWWWWWWWWWSGQQLEFQPSCSLASD